jgi:hypothetical protein
MAVCGPGWSGWVLVLLVVAGCSSHDGAAPQTVASPSLVEMRAEMLRSVKYTCPRVVRSASEAALPDRRQVFAEVFLFEGPSATVRAASLSGLSQLETDSSLRLLGAPHITAGLDSRTEITIAEQIGVSQEASLYRLAVLPRESSNGSVVLELGVTLQLPNPSGADPAPTWTTTLTMTGADQQLLLGTAALPDRRDLALLLLVKNWRLRDSQDLRSIFECKMRQREAELRSRR